MNQRYRYSEDWEQESYDAKARAGWMCEECLVPHGAIVRSPRTGNPYVVYLQAAHVNHDQDNPHAIKKVVCPSCHARYYRRPRRRAVTSSVPVLCKRRRAIRRAWDRADAAHQAQPLRQGPVYSRSVQFAWQLEEGDAVMGALWEDYQDRLAHTPTPAPSTPCVACWYEQHTDAFPVEDSSSLCDLHASATRHAYDAQRRQRA